MSEANETARDFAEQLATQMSQRQLTPQNITEYSGYFVPVDSDIPRLRYGIADGQVTLGVWGFTMEFRDDVWELWWDVYGFATVRFDGQRWCAV